MELLTLLAAGALAGTMAGLLGIGGGTIIVPVIALVLEHQGISRDIIIKVAVGTSLATIMVTAISSVYSHHRRGAVDWQVFRILTPWILGGTVIGTILVDIMPGDILYVAFIIFLYLAATRLAIGNIRGARQLPGLQGMATMGMINGVVSAMMGIGGGVINVPFFTYCSVPIKRAIATAAAIGLPLATVSAIGFIITGLNETGLPKASIGYVNLPIFASVVSASFVFAPLGAKLAHALPDRALNIFFSFFLYIMASSMVWSLLRSPA
jgi:uncharacterized membrane protein YfcA